MNKIKVINKKTGNTYYILKHKFNPIKYKHYKPKPNPIGNRWNPDNIIPNILTLTCKQCGNEQTYSTKYSYRRAMGITGLGKTDKKENAGLCGKCRRSAKRKGWTLSQEDSDTRRLNSYNYAHNTNYTDVSQIPYRKESMKSYRKRVQKMSETQLKQHKPLEYQRLINNRYDGKDLDKLTIDHLTEVNWYYHNNKSAQECSHIDNLEVITMRENILRSNPNAIFKK